MFAALTALTILPRIAAFHWLGIPTSPSATVCMLLLLEFISSRNLTSISWLLSTLTLPDNTVHSTSYDDTLFLINSPTSVTTLAQNAAFLVDDSVV